MPKGGDGNPNPLFLPFAMSADGVDHQIYAPPRLVRPRPPPGTDRAGHKRRGRADSPIVAVFRLSVVQALADSVVNR